MMITFEKVTKVYGSAGTQVKALDEVDLHIEKGEIYGVKS
uniref:Uncharacterized protein n=1 Tax=Virgibacillus oceani TaxID=1479511 RepID=A0A917M6Q9_9BACI|nr:hypothetical protein GCM10011398_30000 [Virgibacillus oceani]